MVHDASRSLSAVLAHIHRNPPVVRSSSRPGSRPVSPTWAVCGVLTHREQCGGARLTDGGWTSDQHSAYPPHLNHHIAQAIASLRSISSIDTATSTDTVEQTPTATTLQTAPPADKTTTEAPEAPILSARCEEICSVHWVLPLAFN
eukprot:5509404-Pleurochrysis_carterae.AAC.1